MTTSSNGQGSITTILTQSNGDSSGEGTLRLQTNSPSPITQEDSQSERRTVRWTDEVVDNEHMNKKKSKVCCIFHPQRQFGESSDESSSSSDSNSSDSESDREYMRRRLANRKKKAKKSESDSESEDAHEHGEGCDHDHDHDHEHGPTEEEREARRKAKLEKLRKRGKLQRNPSPNAYERQPNLAANGDATRV